MIGTWIFYNNAMLLTTYCFALKNRTVWPFRKELLREGQKNFSLVLRFTLVCMT